MDDSPGIRAKIKKVRVPERFRSGMGERSSGTIQEESTSTRDLGIETTGVKEEAIAGTMEEIVLCLVRVVQIADTAFLKEMVVQRAETVSFLAKVVQRIETDRRVGMRVFRVEEVDTEVVEARARDIEVRETEIEAKDALQVKRAGTTSRQGASSSRWIRNKGGIKPT